MAWGMDEAEHDARGCEGGAWRLSDGEVTEEASYVEWRRSSTGAGSAAVGSGEEEEEEEEEEYGGGVGIMEAFENFNQRAEQRIHDLLRATEAKLFTVGRNTQDEATATKESDAPANTPSYILMSDQYRLTKPPVFAHWRAAFPYLQVIGKSSFDEAPDEHIQIRQPVAVRAPLEKGVEETIRGDQPLQVMGKRINLQIDPSDPPQEELIIADGEMEEVLEEDKPSEGDDDSVEMEVDTDDPRPATATTTSCLSPRTSQVDEAIDHLAIDCFVSMVPPLVTSLFESMLRKQQWNRRVARETHEQAVRLARERELFAQEEARRQREYEEGERTKYDEAMAKLAEEQRIQEEARHEELLRQQREENDEEEIKIRTLAYTHQREWYQPQKKCFSHRGRKMRVHSYMVNHMPSTPQYLTPVYLRTYLKPVLKAQEQAQTSVTENASTNGDAPGKNPARPRRTRGTSIHRVTSPSTDDVTLAHPPRDSPQTSPSSARSRPSSSASTHGEEQSTVRLPYLAKSSAVNGSKEGVRRKPTWRVPIEKSPPAAAYRPSSTIAAPTRVYGISPYRIPPTILKSELITDAVATERKKRKQRQRSGDQDE